MSESTDDRFAGKQRLADHVFADLMEFRIRDVLLVSSPYDSYILEEDGFLSESLDVEYHQLNLSAAPRVTRVATGEEALELLLEYRYDLVISMARLGEMDARQFGRAVKDLYSDIPIVLLAYTPTDAARIKQMGDPSLIDRVFIWRGDVRIFLAIIKFIEDLRNVERDSDLAGVRTIILVENSVRFYSSYLPLLYTELMKQNQALMVDGVNASERLRRMKARPKVLLAETFEEGWELFERHRRHILGVISDARFPREGRSDPHAGIEFVRRVRAEDPDMPALVQSSDDGLEQKAADVGAAFLNKRSRRLLQELRLFIQTSLGFGDFVFLLPDGTEVGRVQDLAMMPYALQRIPEESLRYHASRNHFSNWSMARTEFALAERLRPIRVSEFESIDEMRRYLIEAFSQVRTDSQRGIVADFSRVEFGERSNFARIGGGSMGGKGRGLGFINSYLPKSGFDEKFEGIRIYIPPSAVIGTDVFDEFLRVNNLSDLAFSNVSDEEITTAFLKAEFPPQILEDLRVFVGKITYPLAVRSSSLLEDSHDRPFAGIYQTYMLPNNDPDTDTRLEELCAAVKLVYASTFHQNAKAYLANSQHRLEEEKMAVIIQKLVGHSHDGYFYPDIAGVARSYNHYPVLGMTSEEGVALVALGFGKTVVDGERSVRFSPGSPQTLPQFSSTEETLESAQREFYALDMGVIEDEAGERREGNKTLVRLDLSHAEKHGTLGPLGSTYSPDNDAVYDGISRVGPRLVTFASILKSGSFPLAEILKTLLDQGSRATSCPVEIEFAVNLAHTPEDVAEFAFLQIRPMTIEASEMDLDELLSRTKPEMILCSSPLALGRGRIRDIYDVVYVKPADFDRSKTADVARDVGSLNESLEQEGKGYLLVGPGRWGTADPWLGIPVEWHQISAVKTIVETDLDEVPVAPSEGTHFFQNLTSFGIGYFNVDHRSGSGFVDLGLLESLSAVEETTYLRRVRLEKPLEIWVDGRSRKGLILREDPFTEP